MKKKLKNILFFLIFSVSIFGTETETPEYKPIGDLDVVVTLIPHGTTKTYNMDNEGKFILDAGVINAQDGLQEQKIAGVVVEMIAKPTKEYNEDEDEACIIDGQFNGLLDLRQLENGFEKVIPLSTLKKYNGGESANLELKAKNYKIISKDIIEEDLTDREYIFSAYPNECSYKNKIRLLKYSFDLILKATNVNAKDIVRGDINLTDKTVKAITGKGALQDLVEDQIRSIMTDR